MYSLILGALSRSGFLRLCKILHNRKNFLFSGSPRGADASATLYTLVESAKANNLEPWAYLNYLFEKLPAAKSEQALLALLPQNLKTEDLKG
jgi:transposase